MEKVMDMLEFDLRMIYNGLNKDVRKAVISDYEAKDEGENRGSVLKLISLICRKLKKNKTPDVIVEELEEDLESIERICRAAKEFAPDYDEKKIYDVLEHV